MKHQFIGRLEKFTDTRIWSFYIRVPDEIKESLLKTSKRVICEFDEKLKIQMALLPKSDGFYFLNLNKETRKKLGLNEDDEINIEIWSDESEYGIFVPEVFVELCSQDLEGDKVFHELTPGKQRSLLYIMGKPKSEEKQLEKALIIFDYLKSVNGNLDYKELNIAFRENNRFKRF